MANINFHDYFWEKFEDLHQRYQIKFNTVGNIIDFFTKYQQILEKFTTSTTNLITKDLPFYPEKDSTVNEALEHIKSTFAVQITQFNFFIETIKNRIIDPLQKLRNKNFQKELELYSELKILQSNYEEALLNLQKAKEKYYNFARIAELSTKTAKEYELKIFGDITNDQEELINKLEIKANESLLEAKKADEKYIESLNMANNVRNLYNEKESQLLEFYQNKEKTDNGVYKLLLMDYTFQVKAENSVIKENLSQIEEKINQINYVKDVICLINLYGSAKKPDKLIAYQKYELETDLEKCTKDEEYKLSYEVIVNMKYFLDNILPNFDVNSEFKKKELRDLSSKIFKIDSEFTEEEKNKLLNNLKEEQNQNYFLLILSNERIDGRYKRSKKLILFLAEILEKILKLSENTKNYVSAKNCIVLSQTYYYEEDNQKIYLFEFIKKNKWLLSSDFWRKIIEIMIIDDMTKIMKSSDICTGNEKKEAKLNIVFGHLASFCQNMLDFQIDKKIILTIIDEFVKEYEMPENMGRHIYGLIGDDKEIEKLREEFMNTKNSEIKNEEKNKRNKFEIDKSENKYNKEDNKNKVPSK